MVELDTVKLFALEDEENVGEEMDMEGETDTDEEDEDEDGNEGGDE